MEAGCWVAGAPKIDVVAAGCWAVEAAAPKRFVEGAEVVVVVVVVAVDVVGNEKGEEGFGAVPPRLNMEAAGALVVVLSPENAEGCVAC